jgi:hypothetical protein
MTTATARYISNGYIVTWQSAAGGGIVVPPSVYAGSVPEVVYWLGRIFDPVANPAARQAAKEVAPQIIQPGNDALLGQQAQVTDIASGGFLVTQFPSAAGAAQMVEVYCPTMDAVADALTQIFTAPPS